MDFNYNIIEEAPPYYTKFTHDGIDDIIRICKDELTNLNKPFDKFIHHVLPVEASNELMKLLPYNNLLRIRPLRMALFISPPGYRHHVHRDSPHYNYVSINYSIEVIDNNCITYWYDNEICNKYFKETNVHNKEFIKNMPESEVPVQKLSTPQGQCVLLNTDIFHNWHNNSPYHRVVLTLRIHEDDTQLMTYDVVKNILFNNGNVA